MVNLGPVEGSGHSRRIGDARNHLDAALLGGIYQVSSKLP